MTNSSIRYQVFGLPGEPRELLNIIPLIIANWLWDADFSHNKLFWHRMNPRERNRRNWCWWSHDVLSCSIYGLWLFLLTVFLQSCLCSLLHVCQLSTHSEQATRRAPPVPSHNLLPYPVIFRGITSVIESMNCSCVWGREQRRLTTERSGLNWH